jgi:hypothetical protein
MTMPPRPTGPLRQPYLAIKLAAAADLKGDDTSRKILDLVLTSLGFLSTRCKRVELTSQVPRKEYFSYVLASNKKTLSRPVNAALFDASVLDVSAQWNAWIAGELNDASPSLIYTMVTAYCVASDLFDRNNKKGPATYFEIFVGHLFSRVLHINPTKNVTLPIQGKQVQMTMDFLFNVGEDGPRFHLPVKMSTRERVVQAWAHQRLLDAAYGENRYKGILVIHSETKLDLVRREVVEICVPDQWLTYQNLLARMERIYYFDTPERYAELSREFPSIQIKDFSQFFAEKHGLLNVR